jgi:hypothetical protein
LLCCRRSPWRSRCRHQSRRRARAARPATQWPCARPLRCRGQPGTHKYRAAAVPE